MKRSHGDLFENVIVGPKSGTDWRGGEKKLARHCIYYRHGLPPLNFRVELFVVNFRSEVRGPKISIRPARGAASIEDVGILELHLKIVHRGFFFGHRERGFFFGLSGSGFFLWPTLYIFL